MPFLHFVKKEGVIVWNFFANFVGNSKTIAREGIVFGFKKLTAKAQKKTTRLLAKRGKSSKRK